jgi:hypothetical protein
MNMENNEHQLALTLILQLGKRGMYETSVNKPAPWPEIYVEIGKLLERANKTYSPAIPGTPTWKPYEVTC